MNYILRLCRLLAVLVFFLVALIAHAQDPEKGPGILRADAEGTHFIVGFMQNEENTSICAVSGDRALSRQTILIASRVDNMVTVTYPNGESVVRSIAANDPYGFVLNGEEYECLGEGICDKSIEIVAQKPVSVYCSSSKPQSTDGYLALPVSSWSNEYITANYPLDHYDPDSLRDPEGCNTEPRGGEFAVIASEDNTTVMIYPAATTASGYPANQQVTLMLSKGEIWQIQDGGTLRGGTDLTGSRIFADKPVGVLSGHVRTAVPWNQDTKNHLIEMLPPSKTLGKRHIVVPFGGRSGGDIVRVVATYNGLTHISVGPGGQTQYQLLGTGEFQELLITQPTVIETNHPVLVAHYSQSNGIDLNSRFDPYMVITMPEEQFAFSSVFQTMPNGAINIGTGTPQFEQHFVTIVGETESFATMEINGTPIAGSAIVGAGSLPGLESYSWTTIRLSGGQAYTITSEGRFGGYIYGIGEYDSYGWAIGAATDTLRADQIPPQLRATEQCSGHAYRVAITDSGSMDYGIASVQLDAAASSNVRLVLPVPIEPGVEAAVVELWLNNPKISGRARLIVEDLSGNLETLDVDLESNPPSFSRDSLLVSGLRVNASRRESLLISNTSGTQTMRIESLHVVSGAAVSISGLGSGGTIDWSLIPGTSYAVSLDVIANQVGTYHDTLVVATDCYTYRIPIRIDVHTQTLITRDLDFGQSLVDDRKCMVFRLENPGPESIAITDITTEGPFRIDPTSLPALPFVMMPHETREIIICYSPQEVGEHIGTIWVVSSLGTVMSVLQGVGVEVLSVNDRSDNGGHSIGVTQRGDAIVIEAAEGELSLKDIRLIALNGESIEGTQVKTEGAGRLRIDLPASLPSGVYYLRAEGKDGKYVSAKVLVVR